MEAQGKRLYKQEDRDWIIPPEPRRDKEGSSSRAFVAIVASGLQNCDNVNFCCFKLL
jgi:hypothetical protein